MPRKYDKGGLKKNANDFKVRNGNGGAVRPLSLEIFGIPNDTPTCAQLREPKPPHKLVFFYLGGPFDKRAL